MPRAGAFSTGRISGVRARRTRRVCLLALLGCLLGLLGAAPAWAFEDFSGGAFQILAPGEEGALEPGPFATDQGILYNDLTPLSPGTITTKQVEEFYVPEKFGVQGSVMREEHTGRAGLEILRDSHDIPHIYGTTRADVMFGSGWVAAEDRGLLLKLGLGPAYVAADGAPGINAFGLLQNDRAFTPSKQSEEFVEEQTKSLTEKGPEGEQVLKDLEAWVEGVNAYEEKEVPEGSFVKLPHVTLADAIAGFAFIGSIFGDGGGKEVADSNFLANLEKKLGATEGLNVFRDLREVNDPEAPTTASKAFPYDGVPSEPTPGAVVIDPGSISPSGVNADRVLGESRRKASNFLVVGAEKSASGHPLAVMGPQLGYSYPEIVFEADMHGPGIDAEGIVAPISPYVFIGRGRDFAWSLTSAGNENEQQFLEKLCSPTHEPVTRETHFYEHNGECIAMKFFDAGKLGAGEGEPEREVTFYETVHGPISGTVTVHGEPYAIANARTTRGREPAGELAFSTLDSDKVHSPEQFFEAANELETTFNMAYLDSKNIAYFSTGRLPVLAPGTDASLPTLGTGPYDWKGFLSLEQHPHEINPPSGTFLSWNNKPAPEWGAASDKWSYGPVQRVQMYTGFTSGMTEASDVTIMNNAATQDLRAVKLWPLIEEVLKHAKGKGKAKAGAKLIAAWVKEGAHRKGVNRPENPGAAVLDAAFVPMEEAVLKPVLGELVPELESISAPDNPPSAKGSSFDDSWYSYVYKDLSSELGKPVSGPYSRQYCGGGNISTCATSLWSALGGAAGRLEKLQGKKDKNWRAAEVHIEFPPGLLPFTMTWTNRSTFQQVIEFTGHAE